MLKTPSQFVYDNVLNKIANHFELYMLLFKITCAIDWLYSYIIALSMGSEKGKENF